MKLLAHRRKFLGSRRYPLILTREQAEERAKLEGADVTYCLKIFTSRTTTEPRDGWSVKRVSKFGSYLLYGSPGKPRGAQPQK